MLIVVDPERRGEGIGTALRGWAEDRAREKGRQTLRQDVGDRNTSAREHLTLAGYERERSYWRMELELDGSETPPAPPKGFTIRALDPAADAPALYVVNEAAFAGNADYEPESETHFGDEHLRGHNLKPELSLVAEHGDGVAGFALVRDHGDKVAYVDLLAVHPDFAGLGLGSALLRTAFAGASQAGFRSGRLGVASDNPNAIRLYARVGMTQRWRVDSYARALLAVQPMGQIPINIADHVGRTPMVQLGRLAPDGAQVFGKLEMLNPGPDIGLGPVQNDGRLAAGRPGGIQPAISPGRRLLHSRWCR